MDRHQPLNRQSASASRAIEKSRRVARLCERVIAEMDEVTANHGIPTAELDDGDSIVIAVERTLAAAGKS